MNCKAQACNWTSANPWPWIVAVTHHFLSDKLWPNQHGQLLPEFTTHTNRTVERRQSKKDFYARLHMCRAPSPIRRSSDSPEDATPGLYHKGPIISARPLARGPAGAKPPLSVAPSWFPQWNPWLQSTKPYTTSTFEFVLFPSFLSGYVHRDTSSRFQKFKVVLRVLCDISPAVACYTRFSLPSFFSFLPGTSHVEVMTRPRPTGPIASSHC